MRDYLRFLRIGLVLGLFTEVELKWVAGTNPRGMIIVLIAYPVILTVSFAVSGWIDRVFATSWKGDLFHYGTVGLGGLAFEWVLLGNGPGSNAFQLGMFAMWTTFCFGPRLLMRPSPRIKKSGRRFWMAFGLVAILLTWLILLPPQPGSRLVVAVFGLSATYAFWSGWLLLLAWKTRRDPRIKAAR